MKAQAQEPQSDTVAANAYADSAIEVEQADTAYERSNYFELKGPDTGNIEIRSVPARVVDSLKKSDAFWYADYVFKKKEAREQEIRSSRAPRQWLNTTALTVILVLFLGLLLWYLFKNNIISGRRSSKGSRRPEDISEENIFEINYQQEIDMAMSAGDYRLATRLLFLRLLKNLSQKKIIQYKQERTNFDYLSQLYTTAYYKDFFRLTRNYEYAWYGKFDVSRESFAIIKNEFENFEATLS